MLDFCWIFLNFCCWIFFKNNFVYFLFRFVFGRFDTSGSMIPRLVPKISPCDGFCDGAPAAGGGIGYSRSLIEQLATFVKSNVQPCRPCLTLQKLCLLLTFFIYGVHIKCFKTHFFNIQTKSFSFCHPESPNV